MFEFKMGRNYHQIFVSLMPPPKHLIFFHPATSAFVTALRVIVLFTNYQPVRGCFPCSSIRKESTPHQAFFLTP